MTYEICPCCGKPKKPKAAVSGRWPSNILHDGSAEVLAGFPVTTTNSPGQNADTDYKSNGVTGWKGTHRPPASTGSAARFFYCAKASRAERNAGLEGMEAREYGAYANGKGMPGRTLIDGEWVQTGTWDEPNRKPQANNHPTVKPLALMRYLCRLTKTPTGGVVLDPFAGSGSTGCAAVMEGRRFIGIELSDEYAEIARARIAHAASQLPVAEQGSLLLE